MVILLKICTLLSEAVNKVIFLGKLVPVIWDPTFAARQRVSLLFGLQQDSILQFSGPWVCGS